ncbi:epoxide hydrolase, soluble (sEH), partial [Quaeritorhiza haematococci]
DEFEITSPSKEPDGQYTLSWCPSRFQPQMLVVGCGKENVARIYRVDQHNKWVPFEVLGGHGDLVCDVAWAPSMGRSYQLIATACKDTHVRIFKLTDESTSARLPPTTSISGPTTSSSSSAAATSLFP